MEEQLNVPIKPPSSSTESVAVPSHLSSPTTLRKKASPTQANCQRERQSSSSPSMKSSSSKGHTPLRKLLFLSPSWICSIARSLRGSSGKRKLLIAIALLALFLSTMTFAVYNDGDANSMRHSPKGVSTLQLLRRTWLAQLVWLAENEEDDESKEGKDGVNVTSIAEPPQKRVLEEQLFTKDSQRERKKRVNDICDEYDLRGSPLELARGDLKQIIVDDNNKLLYCYIPKVACTNWKRIMLILTGTAGEQKNPLDIQASDSHTKTGFKTLDQFTDSEILHRVKTYFKFMFVRHPFERLLSAYKNKFSERYSVYFQKKFGRKIIRRYRPEAKAESLVYGNDVTFREFVTYVLDPRTHVEGLNEHWRQYYKLCHPCHLNYDLIGKYETLYPDARTTLDLAGVGDRVAFPTYPPAIRKKRAKTIDYIRDFFATIPATELRDLKATYGLDFEFFGYKYPFLNDSGPNGGRDRDEE